MFIINKNKLKIEYLMIYNFLFPTKPITTKTSLLLTSSPDYLRSIINESRNTKME